MKQLLKYIPALALACVAFSCKPDFEDIEATNFTKGELDFTKYVATGDYITAGYTNGGISRESQQYAYPNILAQQFAKAGGPVTPFVQPYFNGSTLMLTLGSEVVNGVPKVNNAQEMQQFLNANCSANPLPTYPRFSSDVATTESLQNLGVPGLKFTQFRRINLGLNSNNTNAVTDDYNPFFERLIPENDGRSYMRVVNSSKPTFFTLWLGMSDVIPYALSGASCGTLPSSATFNTELITALDSLSQVVKQADNSFKSTRKGVICNIPAIEFYAFTKLADPAKLRDNYRIKKGDQSLQIWAQKQTVQGVTSNTVLEVASDDYILPKGLATLGREDATLDTRNINGVDQIIPHGLSKENPLTNEEILDATETKFINSRITAYNKAMRDRLVVSNSNQENISRYVGMVIYADIERLFSDVNAGLIYNGIRYSATPFSGGFFSLDNFTLTPRGQAMVANEIIQTMNQEPGMTILAGFGTKVPQVNVNDYPVLKLQ